MGVESFVMDGQGVMRLWGGGDSVIVPVLVTHHAITTTTVHGFFYLPTIASVGVN